MTNHRTSIPPSRMLTSSYHAPATISRTYTLMQSAPPEAQPCDRRPLAQADCHQKKKKAQQGCAQRPRAPNPQPRQHDFLDSTHSPVETAPHLPSLDVRSAASASFPHRRPPPRYIFDAYHHTLPLPVLLSAAAPSRSSPGPDVRQKQDPPRRLARRPRSRRPVSARGRERPGRRRRRRFRPRAGRVPVRDVEEGWRPVAADSARAGLSDGEDLDGGWMVSVDRSTRADTMGSGATMRTSSVSSGLWGNLMCRIMRGI